MLNRFAPFLLCCAAALACAADSAQEPSAERDPLASFAKLVDGEWRMGGAGDWIQFDTWTFGPRHRAGHGSVRNDTYGSDATGGPWRGVDVYYRRPGSDDVRMLSLHQDVPGIGRGVAEGVMRFDGDRAEGELELFQPASGAQPRELVFRWSFDGPDRYRETLLEATGGAGLTFLAEWNYERAERRGELPALEEEQDVAPARHRALLEPLLGRAFTAELARDGADALRVQTTLEWIPLVDVAHARATTTAPGGEPEHVLDAYLYHHPTRDELRCLALSKWGVHEGAFSVGEDGAVELDLESAEVGRRVVRLELDPDSEPGPEPDPESGGALRTRVWSTDGAERKLTLDLRHAPSVD